VKRPQALRLKVSGEYALNFYPARRMSRFRNLAHLLQWHLKSLSLGIDKCPHLITEILRVSDVSHRSELIAGDAARAPDRDHDITAFNSGGHRLQPCENPRRKEPSERRGMGKRPEMALSSGSWKFTPLFPRRTVGGFRDPCFSPTWQRLGRMLEHLRFSRKGKLAVHRAQLAGPAVSLVMRFR
jgi:hypothetical protein